MAIVVSNIGTVDLPAGFVGTSGNTDLKAIVVDLTIQAADYSSGLPLTAAAKASIGITAVMHVSFTVRAAGGARYNALTMYDVANDSLVALVAFTPTHYTAVNGDIFRCLVIGL